MSSDPSSPGTRRARLRKTAGVVFSLTLFVLAMVTLRHFLRDHSLSEIVETARSRPGGALAKAIAATALSYFVLSGYDWLALRYIGAKIAYRRVAVGSFISYAFSHNIGMSALSGGSARYRFYSKYGVTVFGAARLVLFCNITFWVGLCALGGVVLTFHPIAVPMLEEMPFDSVSALGVVGLTVTIVAAALTAWGKGRPRLRVWGLTLHLPDFPLFLRQVVVSSADWAAAAVVLHVLLPDAYGSYLDTLSLFMVAHALAMVSNLPGGMGVFESVAIYLAGDADPAELLGVILVYRAVYYLLPLVIAVMAFLVMEWRRRSRPTGPSSGDGPAAATDAAGRDTAG